MTDKTATTDLNAQRRKAVQLRLSGSTLAAVREEVGLSTPTIVAAVKAFKEGGWPAVDVKPRGRPKRDDAQPATRDLTASTLLQAAAAEPGVLWSTQQVKLWLEHEHNIEVGIQTAAAYLQNWTLAPINRSKIVEKSGSATGWLNAEYADFKKRARKSGATVLWVGLQTCTDGFQMLYAHTLRGRAYWIVTKGQPRQSDYDSFFNLLHNEYSNGLALVLPNQYLTRNISSDWLLLVTPEATALSNQTAQTNHKNPLVTDDTTSTTDVTMTKNRTPLPKLGLTHLQRLESESIQIMREVFAEANNPVMLYSIGKDSAVMMHLARKAFYPAPPPLPLLHVDTTWKFQEMYRFRDTITKEYGFELLTHINADGVAKGVNPFTHGSALHTDIMKTEALKQALDKHGFDIALGGARRDEEKSRAKERVFSFRTSQHRWEPKNQRPELWNIYNTRKNPGESIRVFPLSNWTELDIWQYIHSENIPIVPLYLAAERPVVERDGMLIMVDDDRMPLKDDEVPTMRQVRFRTLGCYPLTGAIESNATTVPEIIQEMLLTKTSERQGRMIDHDNAASMEKKKQEGYF
jgi:sulfate adenylyltransferase subunit 2